MSVRLRECRHRLLNAVWRWRHDLMHLRVTCRRCGQRVWFMPRDWEWSVNSFSLFCRPCQREHERREAAWFAAMEER